MVVVVVVIRSISGGPGHLEDAEVGACKSLEQTLAHIESTVRTAGACVLDGRILGVSIVRNGNRLATPRRSLTEVAVLCGVEGDDKVGARVVVATRTQTCSVVRRTTTVRRSTLGEIGRAGVVVRRATRVLGTTNVVRVIRLRRNQSRRNKKRNTKRLGGGKCHAGKNCG